MLQADSVPVAIDMLLSTVIINGMYLYLAFCKGFSVNGIVIGL